MKKKKSLSLRWNRNQIKIRKKQSQNARETLDKIVPEEKKNYSNETLKSFFSQSSEEAPHWLISQCER